MRKMVVQIPEDLFKALKVHAAQEDTTMKELVEIALRRLLKVPEGGESGKR